MGSVGRARLETAEVRNEEREKKKHTKTAHERTTELKTRQKLCMYTVKSVHNILRTERIEFVRAQHKNE